VISAVVGDEDSDGDGIYSKRKGTNVNDAIEFGYQVRESSIQAQSRDS